VRPIEATSHRFIDDEGLRGRGMHPPAIGVSRLLYGTGFGLLLGVGLGLQAGRSVTSQPPVLILLAAGAVLSIVLGWMLANGSGPLAALFSHETDEAMAARVQYEIDDVQRSEDVNSKWAELEAKVLTHDLGEEA